MALLPKQFESMSLDDDDNIEPVPVPKGSKKKTVEQTYKKISQLEHILLRPDTYIGSSERMTQTIWVWNETTKRMVYKEVTFPPGLYKIFDEILVNAADHKQRDKSMNMIKVEIDPENNMISVWNNGAGIPVEIHKEEKVYVPELIFGHLLTSSNYDDDEKKVVGGRNGYGAKLANIFSTEFIVETASSATGKKYKQVFNKNMSIKGKPVVKSGNKKDNWTKITFYPDLEKFDMTCFDADIVSLLKKRVYDVAGINPGIKVYLNGEKLPVKSFKDYVNLYVDGTGVYYERLNERWEVAIAPSDGQLTQVSFVNSIWTMKGGTHVNNVADQIVKEIGNHITKKDKKMKVKPFQIKSQLSLYVNCLIENPAFDSQTKETLTTKPSQFGSKWKFTEEFAKKIMKSEIIANVLEYARFKQSKELQKTDGRTKGRIMGIQNLDDANKAGGREASKCTLILTEGLSAKALVVSAFSVIGRDYYGCFPLRGKLLNVREASHKQIMDNAEINNLKKILGLQHKKKYDAETIKTLRYGHVVIMTDQDHDGSHIKGLLLNFFDHFWPGLLQIKGFLQEFITPIVKVWKGKQREVFYTQPEYKTWCEENPTKAAKWESKYLKGLGGSDKEDAKIYFSDLKRHLLTFRYGGEDDKVNIDMAFSKQRAEDRKQWLSAFVPGTFFDYGQDDLTYSNFVNKELILFSMADNARSIPSVIDGLKPSQRKVLFGTFKKKAVSEIKVGTLCGYVAEHTMYHHGDASLQATIVGLAQTFVGSNNINLLHPGGMFGTRLQGGKDAASARYISTRLTNSARALFPVLDDPVLSYLVEESKSIEPEWYCPVIPMVLVNGSDGIGTGWSTSVPSYNPRDIIKNIRAMLRGERPSDMLPWYRGFKGQILPVANSKSFDVHGILMKCEEATTLKIKELPIGLWTQSYKEFLEANAIGHADAAKKPYIKDILDNGTESDVCFTINVTQEGYKMLASSGFFKKLKLSGSVATSNMVLFDNEGRIRKYEHTSEILEEFFHVRLDLYKKRKTYLLKELRDEELRLSNRARFIQMVIAGTLKVSNRPKKELMAELKKKKFDQIFPKKKNARAGDAEEEPAEESDDEDDTVSGKGYDYLLSMPLWSLTKERVAKLLEDVDLKNAEIDEMEATTEQALWEKDLSHLEEVLDDNDKKMAKYEAELAISAREARLKQQKGAKGKGRKKAAIVYNDGASDNDEEIRPPAARTIAAKKARKPKAEPKLAKKPARAGPSTVVKKEEDIEIVGMSDDDDFEMDVKPLVNRPSRAVSRKPTQKMVLDDDDEEESSEEDSDDAFDLADMMTPVKKKKAPARGASRKAKPAIAVDDSEDEEDIVEKKPVAKKNSRTARRPVVEDSDSDEEEEVVEEEDVVEDDPVKEEEVVAVDSDSDEDAPMSLAERLAKRLAITSPEQVAVEKKTSGKPPLKKGAKKTTTKDTSAAAVKRPRSKGTTLAASNVGVSPSVARKVKRTRVKTPKGMKMKPSTKKKGEDLSAFDLEGEEVEEVEEAEESDESEEEVAPALVNKRRPQRGNARKPIIVDSSEEEEKDDSEFEADDDDSDFE